MKNLFALFFIPLLLLSQERRQSANLILDNIPDVPSHIVDRVAQYENARGARFVAWDPNGEGMLIATRFGETTQLFYVKAPLGMRNQLTFFPDVVGTASFYPGKDRHMFVFRKDVGGNEFYQLYAFDMTSGSCHMVTDGSSRNFFAGWSKSGQRFLYTSTKRDGVDNDIYIGSVDDMKQGSMLLRANGSWDVQDWSGDEKTILVRHFVSVAESHLYLVDAATGARIEINPGLKVSYQRAMLSKDGGGIYYLSDELGEQERVIYLDLKKNTKKAFSGKTPWDVSSFTISNTGKYLFYVLNEGGVSTLHLLDIRTRRNIPVAPLPPGVVSDFGFAKDDRHLAVTLESPQTMGDVYVLELATGRFKRWTQSEVGGLNTHDFVLPTLIKYKSFDGREIPAWYYPPRQSHTLAPVIVSIHGGPEGQARPTFSPLTQYWINELGAAVLYPNVRGSTGYGKTYRSLDDGFKRENAVKDIGALLDWIAEQPLLDKNRVGLYGGSYGGYMVLSTMCNYNNRIKCGVDICGISNFVTFLQQTESYRRDLRRVEYGDERDSTMQKYLTAISPATNAHNITHPLFVVQGKNDPRVPVAESEQIVGTVRKNGTMVWYMLALDEGHGFTKKSNRDYFTNVLMLFWEKYLLQR